MTALLLIADEKQHGRVGIFGLLQQDMRKRGGNWQKQQISSKATAETHIHRHGLAYRSDFVFEQGFVWQR
ncbi:hypothetical protein [Vitreoscilla massiliensis]|uniref:hypothetical protein n=1 Tax=Vitreoscilla massiliensis TaxID=1689272 RepID=UPI00071D528C|nr:hypothetical protein [Vitreoscilla massiliensis]